MTDSRSYELTRTTLANASAEGGGIWRLTVVGPWNINLLVDDARNGDPDAQRLVLICGLAQPRLDAHAAPSDASPTCLLCRQPFWCSRYPHLVVVLTADVPEPVATCACGVCYDCWAARDNDRAFRAAMLDAFRAQFGLALRMLPALHPAGHA